MKLEQLGILKRKDEVITEKDIKNMIRLNNEGYPMRVIAAAYNRRQDKVTYLCNRYKQGIVVNEIFLEKKFDFGKLRALLNAGWDNKKLADEFEISIDEVKEKVQELVRIEKRCKVRAGNQ